MTDRMDLGIVQDAIDQLEHLFPNAERATDAGVICALSDTALYDAQEKRIILDVWRERHPYPRLGDHELNHVLTDLASESFNLSNEGDVRQLLIDKGYDSPVAIAQVLREWRNEERMRLEAEARLTPAQRILAMDVGDARAEIAGLMHAFAARMEDDEISSSEVLLDLVADARQP